MQTGENEQGLRRILDLTRMIGLVILILHLYLACFAAFAAWGWETAWSDKIMVRLLQWRWLSVPIQAKSAVLLSLVISLLGSRGRKEEHLAFKIPIRTMIIGLLLFFGSDVWLWTLTSPTWSSGLFMATTALGYLLLLSGGTRLSRVITQKLDDKDIFNKLNETFPQEERLLENEFSINLPATYQLKGKTKASWINIINPFRGILVLGNPGSGKTYFVIRHLITQHIRKGFSMFVYDFKYDDLTRIVYNNWKKYKSSYPVVPAFYVIDFDHLSHSHRCNPLEHESMTDITDAAESARTILLGLNRDWIRRQGDFFIESPINFVTAIIWFLKKYDEGRYCTLPHVIELMQEPYDRLFEVLKTEKEIAALINPFLTAFENKVMEQLEGQIASAKIALARLSSPQLYFVLSGNDFTLDINDPEKPKIVCMGNNPQKIQIYGAVLSLYVNRLIKQVNRKGMCKSSLVFDEFPTIYLSNMDALMATARSNKVSTCLGIQDFSQLRKDYGREQADVIANIAGNVISGQVSGDTAKNISERIGRVMQDRQSLSINSQDTSINNSKQLESASPVSRIAGLSSGEFVGTVADSPDCPIELKAFHSMIQNNHAALKAEDTSDGAIPLIRRVDQVLVERCYEAVKKEIEDLVVRLISKAPLNRRTSPSEDPSEEASTSEGQN